MIFLSLIVVLLLVQWWGSGAPLQRDGWFIRWQESLASIKAFRATPALHLILTLLVPTLALALLVAAIQMALSANWLFFIYVPVLLYSLGRGNFSAEVKAYIAASERGDTVVASRLAEELRGGAEPENSSANVENWPMLHGETLRVISYRGFERMFAVLFWFFIVGAVGALLYRLSVIYRERETVATPQGRLAARWLWLMEWPAVRMMGLTWALVGNFETCYRCWQARLLDVKHSSMSLLNNSLRGALGIDDPVLGNCEATGESASFTGESTTGGSTASRATNSGSTNSGSTTSASTINESTINTSTSTPNELTCSLSLIKNSLPLFSRSLLLWVCVIALITLLL